MPWTLSHPAAILPFKRLCPKYLSLPALVAGSVAPDSLYHAGRFDIASFAHTFAGSIVVCIPSGLALLLAFFLARRPLWFLLPEPHRSALAASIAKHPCMDARGFAVATVSILLGAWTHLIWDSFTHGGTWIVDRVALLREPWLRIGAVELPGYTVLQDLSTLTGAAALIAVYFSWLRQQPRTSASNSGSDGWRYLVLSSAVLASAGIAVFFALDAATASAQQATPRDLAVRAAIYALSSFALMSAAYSALYFALRRKT